MTCAAGAGKKRFTSMRELAITCDSHSMKARIDRGRNGRAAAWGAAGTAAAGAIAGFARRGAAPPRAPPPPARVVAGGEEREQVVLPRQPHPAVALRVVGDQARRGGPE